MNSFTRSIATLALAAAAFSAPSLAQSTTRASVDSSGAQGNDDSRKPAISADGRFVVFFSNASNLAAGDTNGYADVFLRDRIGGTTERVSVGAGGAQGDSGSFSSPGSISADNRFVAFESVAANLVAGDVNGVSDIFVRDRTSGTTERVSASTGGEQGNMDSWIPVISADGRIVAFASSASNLVPGDTNGDSDIFAHDRLNGTTERVSVGTSGTQANSASWSPSISADGRFVAFDSYASTIVLTDGNGAIDVFVHDRASATAECVSVDSSGAPSNDDSYTPSISADGRFVAFASDASNLVAGDTNMVRDVFVRDRATSTTARVSIDSSGAPGNSTSGAVGVAISSDGRCVAFHSHAKNLVPGDTNGMPDIFVHDRASGITGRVSVDSAGAQTNAPSTLPVLSSDGRFVAFDSNASNLVALDTNGADDVFVRDRGAPPSSYCTPSTSSNGCSASIAASANPSVSLANACQLTVANVDGLKSGLVFYGIDNAGFTALPWAPGSTSSLCVKPPTQRTAIQSSGGTASLCDGSYALDWNAYQSANPLSLGNPWSVGAKVYAQAWFRDPPAAKSTNLSNAVELTYWP
jgi:Tol biopolymer transport system component